MIANSAASITSSNALGGFGRATTSTDTSDGDTFSSLVDQSSQSLARSQAQQTQAQQAEAQAQESKAADDKAASDKAADDVSAAQDAAKDQATKDAANQAAADQAAAAQTAAQTAAAQATAARKAASTQAGSAQAGLQTQAATTLAATKPPAVPGPAAAAPPQAAPPTSLADAASMAEAAAKTAAQQGTDGADADVDAKAGPGLALPGATASSTPTSATLAMLMGAGATPSATTRSDAAAQGFAAAPTLRGSPAIALRVSSPVSVRVTSTTPSLTGTSSAPSASTWQADLLSAASAASLMGADAGGFGSDASSSSTLVAILGAASQVADSASGPMERSAVQSANGANPLSAAGLSAVPADTARFVGAAASGSDAGSQDANQQGAAKTARDRASAVETADADSDMPDAVLEAAFGGLLAATPAATTSSNDGGSTDAEVTSGAISDLASQIASQPLPDAGGVKSFQIVLNPEGLGQVTVSVSIAPDGKLKAAFTFEKADAATAISAHAGDLHAALAQSGFDASATGLSFAAADGQVMSAAAVASAPPARTLTLNLSQDLDLGGSAGRLSGGSVQGAAGSVRDWTLASRTAGLSGPAQGRPGDARGLDVRA